MDEFSEKLQTGALVSDNYVALFREVLKEKCSFRIPKSVTESFGLEMTLPPSESFPKINHFFRAQVSLMCDVWVMIDERWFMSELLSMTNDEWWVVKSLSEYVNMSAPSSLRRTDAIFQKDGFPDIALLFKSLLRPLCLHFPRLIVLVSVWTNNLNSGRLERARNPMKQDCLRFFLLFLLFNKRNCLI